MEKQNKKDHYLNELFDKECLNPKEFAESLGFDRVDRIYNVISGRNNVSIELARIIHEKYPYISIEWIKTGKGEMMSGDKSQEAMVSYPLSYIIGREKKIEELFEQVNELNIYIKELITQNYELKIEIEKKKADANRVETVECADVKPTGSD